MNQQIINGILATYSDRPAASVEHNEVAMANEVYAVTDDNGHQYVVRILRTQTPESARLEAGIQQRLLAQGVGTAEYLTLKTGDVVGQLGEDHFTIADYVEGERPATVTAQLIEDFGATLGRMHQALADVEVPLNALQWMHPTNAHHEIDIYDGPYRERLSALDAVGVDLFSRNLPRTLAHTDFTVDNVFAKADRISTVFDFETAEHTLRIIDIARTYLSMRRTSNFTREEVLTSLVRGYNTATNTPLTAEELNALPTAIRYVGYVCAAWIANNDSDGLAASEAYLALADE